MPLAVATGAWVGLGILYFVLLVTLGLMSLRKGHWVWFILGIFIPVCWLIGALLPPTRARVIDGFDPAMVLLEGGRFLMGTQRSRRVPRRRRGPPTPGLRLNPFWIDSTAVSNARFEHVRPNGTGYVTEAEKYGWSFVFRRDTTRELHPTPGRLDCTLVASSTWRQLAASRRAEIPYRRSHGPPRRPRLLARCTRLLQVGRQATPYRSRVGVRGSRRARAADLPLGR